MQSVSTVTYHDKMVEPLPSWYFPLQHCSQTLHTNVVLQYQDLLVFGVIYIQETIRQEHRVT